MNQTSLRSCLFLTLTVLGLIGTGCNASLSTAPIQTQDATQITLPLTATLPLQNPQTPTPDFRVDSSCWEIEPLQEESNLPGSIIIGSSAVGNRGDDATFYYWDASSFDARQITWDIELPTWWVSSRPSRITPDGNFLVFFLPGEKDSVNLALTSPNNTLSVALPAAEYSVHYLANRKILVASETNREINSKNYEEGVGFTDVFYVFDPATNILESASIFLPHFAPGYKGEFLINYSPDGNHVLYRSTQNGDNGYSLLDISNNEVKWVIPASIHSPEKDRVGPSSIPIWTPDSNSLVYTLSTFNDFDPDFYRISVDGEISQFMDLNGLLGDANGPPSLPQWSLDRRYLMFTHDYFNISVLDTVENVLLTPCLPVDGIVAPPNLMWSFDSKYIVVQLAYDATPTPAGSIGMAGRYMILDIPNRRILELPDKQDMHEYLKLPDEKYPYFRGIIGWVNWEIP